MADRTYRWLLVSLAAFGLTADLASKYGVFRWLYHKDPAAAAQLGNEHVVVPGWFKLISQFDPSTPPSANPQVNALQTWSAPVMPRVNHGALFGMGGGQKGLANGTFAAVSMAAAIAIIVWGTRPTTARERGLTAALGLILGGTIGNLYDRLVFGGVRDFLYFHYVEWPVFNVADCCLVVGAGLLLVQAVFVAPTEQADVPEETAVAEGPKA